MRGNNSQVDSTPACHVGVPGFDPRVGSEKFMFLKAEVDKPFNEIIFYSLRR